MFLWKRFYHRPLQYVTRVESVGGRNKSAPIPTIRLCNEEGEAIVPLPQELTKSNTIIPIYKQMLLLATMDKILYEAQRQGRISFYMTSTGEEATHFGSAAAMQENDHIFAQYRETGVLLARGFTLQQMLHQMTGNCKDLGKGRQMPVHYGSAALKIQTISSPLGTQLPQAVGAAYRLKLQKSPNLPFCYFGEGAASEGDFHAAMNMASTLKTPLVFFCRNNSFAISTPDHEQYAGDGIAARGPAYGIPTFRVDGNDLWAVYAVTKAARELALEEVTPVLIEAITYRVGHHSTSDDSSAYRALNQEEINKNCPVSRVQRYLQSKKLISPEEDEKWRSDAKNEVIFALESAEKFPKPPLKDMFTDVYDEMPPHLQEQYKELLDHLKRFPDEYSDDLSKFSK